MGQRRLEGRVYHWGRRLNRGGAGLWERGAREGRVVAWEGGASNRGATGLLEAQCFWAVWWVQL